MIRVRRDPEAVARARAQALADRRGRMACTRLQGRLALGPELCARLDRIAEDPATPWPMREAIRSAGTAWRPWFRRQS